VVLISSERFWKIFFRIYLTLFLFLIITNGKHYVPPKYEAAYITPPIKFMGRETFCQKYPNLVKLEEQHNTEKKSIQKRRTAK